MQIHIHASGFPVTEGLRAHALRHLARALGGLRHAVGVVSLRFSDLNGPRGGADKRCQVSLAAPGVGSVVVNQVHADLYLAMDRALRRAGRVLTRRMARTRAGRHQAAVPEVEPM